MAALLKDSRDTPFLKQIIISSLLMIPSAAWLYFNPSPWYLNLAYWIMVIFFLGPHLLMLHNICHRSPWTKNAKRFFDPYLELFGLLFGLPPMIYFHHHIKMHHREGNGPKDLSSTEHHKRDSFFSWLLYFFRFSFMVPFELPIYFIKRNRIDYAVKVAFGYLIFISVLVTAYQYNPMGTIVIFLVPQAICWFGLMGGNWAQHAFIDQEDPENSYKNSITIIDSLYNTRCFNDGYHIGHHLYPGMHWSEMPQEFDQNKATYYENDALIFRKLDYQMIWFLLMIKQYKFLAKFYVPSEGEALNIEVIAARIRSKMAPLKA